MQLFFFWFATISKFFWRTRELEQVFFSLLQLTGNFAYTESDPITKNASVCLVLSRNVLAYLPTCNQANSFIELVAF